MMRGIICLSLAGLLLTACASECERKAAKACEGIKAISESAYEKCVEAAVLACEKGEEIKKELEKWK